MRLFIRVSKNSEAIPFNYQQKLTGCIHKWIGACNKEHGMISLYSFSWLQNTRATKNGIWTTPNSYLFLSFHEVELTKQVISGILKDPIMFNGMTVKDVQISNTPDFGTEQRFLVASPIFIKRKKKNNGGTHIHYTFEHKESAAYMTETLKEKLEKAGLDAENVSVRFDADYAHAKTKLIAYGEVKNKVNLCPVIVSGAPEQIAFAYDVGIGNSTGIGFGALNC